jgi:hypothetical protein
VQLQLDAIASNAVLTAIPPSFNSFHRVLDDISERLPKLAAVANHEELAVRWVEREADGGMRDLMEE